MSKYIYPMPLSGYSVGGDSLELLAERDSLRHALETVTKDSLQFVKDADELRRENEVLRRQIDTSRTLCNTAWKRVAALSAPLTNTEHDKYHGFLSRDDFDELMEDRYVDSQGI